jgi:hypothetical protein
MEKQEKDKRNSPVFFSAEMSPKHLLMKQAQEPSQSCYGLT